MIQTKASYLSFIFSVVLYFSFDAGGHKMAHWNCVITLKQSVYFFGELNKA